MSPMVANKVAFCELYDIAVVKEVKDGQLALVAFTKNDCTYHVVYDLKRHLVTGAYTGQNQVLRMNYAERSMLTNRLSVELEARTAYFQGIVFCKSCDGYRFNGNCRCA